MFGKKQICPRCGNKSSKKYTFCPHCGNNFKSSEGEFFEPSFNMGFPFNTIFKQLEKQIEKQFRELDKQVLSDSHQELPPTFMDDSDKQNKPKTGQASPFGQSPGISISISSSGGQPVIRVRNMGDNQRVHRVQAQSNQTQPVKDSLPKNKLTAEQIEKFSRLPKEEPQTSVRRLTDRIVYEIDMPGVEEKNIHITKLQNSIEIKAFAKDKAFFKLIPIALPIIKSQLSEGKLVLELKPSN
jgi:HSP20 family molecular chaperone IbpA